MSYKLSISAFIILVIAIGILPNNIVSADTAVTINVTDGYALVKSATSTAAEIRIFDQSSVNLSISSDASVSNYQINVYNIVPDFFNITSDTTFSVFRSEYSLTITMNLSIGESYYLNISRAWIPSQFLLVVTGDTRPSTYGQVAVNTHWSDILNDIVNGGYSVMPVILTGDLVAGAGTFTDTPAVTSAMLEAFWNSTKNNGSFIPVVGNHDMARGSTQYQAETLWESTFGSLNYSYPLGDKYYIIVTDTYKDGDAYSYSDGDGFLRNTMWDWTKSEIENHTSYHIIVANHHPPYDSGGTSSWQDSTNCINFRNLLESNNVFMNCLGHRHAFSYSVNGGTIYLTEGRGGAPLNSAEGYADDYGFTILWLNETGLVKYVYTNVTANDISIAYNNSNDYTTSKITATFTNGYSIDVPFSAVFRLRGTVTNISVTNASYYSYFKNRFGTFVYAISEAAAGSVKKLEISSSENQPSANDTENFGYFYRIIYTSEPTPQPSMNDMKSFGYFYRILYSNATANNSSGFVISHPYNYFYIAAGLAVFFPILGFIMYKWRIK